MMIVWGRANSSNVMKVVWLLEELGLPYERREAGGRMAKLDTPEFTAMNPNRLIPVLQDVGGKGGDFTLWESNAILRYLATVTPEGASFYPSEPRARAEVERWLDWQQSTLSSGFGRLFYQVARKPKQRQHPKVIERALEGATKVWGVVEQALGEEGGVAGPDITLADIAMGPLVHRWFALPVSRPDLPKLAAWHGRLMTRPPYAAHVAAPPKEAGIKGAGPKGAGKEAGKGRKKKDD